MSTPLLRIEIGLHAGFPRRAATDRAGRLLVTGGDDCTARVWDVQTGELLKVLRPPIGSGHQGKVFSVAMLPDGSAVAIAGVLAEEAGWKTRVFLCSTEDGELIWVSDPVAGYQRQIVFTPAGDRLVVSTSSVALSLLDARDGKLLLTGTDPVSDVYGVETDGTNIWLGSFDGMLRMYDMALARKKKLSVGNQLYQLALSPDGKKLAVGLNNASSVRLYHARSLRAAGTPDCSGVTGYLNAIGWSGKRLYAAGSWMNNGRMVRCWEDMGKGPHRDLRIASLESVLSIAPLPQGVVCLGSPWAVVDGASDPWPPPKALIPFWQAGPSLQVSEDGMIVRFRWGDKPDDWGSFSIADRSLKSVDSDPLRPPRTVGLPVQSWQSNYRPTFNGNALPMESWEAARSLAIHADDSFFVLGCEFNLRCFNRQGTQQWSRATPGVVWSVNLSADGALIIASVGDGTIRWFRSSDGAPLLTLFPHAERQPWVCWTPSGFYSVAPGTEGMIGWHVNRGQHLLADFFPISRFSAQLHHPEAPLAVLTARDEAAGLSAIGLAPVEVTGSLPPVLKLEEVWIAQASTGSDSADGGGANAEGAAVAERLKLTVSGRSPSGQPIDRVWARVDGRPAGESVDARSAEGPWTLSMPIQPFARQVAVFAAAGEAVSVAMIVPPQRLKDLLIPPEAELSAELSAELPEVSEVARPAQPVSGAAQQPPAPAGAARPAPRASRARPAAPPAPAAAFRALVIGEQPELSSGISSRFGAEVRRMDFSSGLDWLRQNPAGLSILALPCPEGRARDLRFPDEKPVTSRALYRAVEDFPGRLLVLIDGGDGRSDVDLSVLLERLAAPELGAMVMAMPPNSARMLESTSGNSVESLCQNLRQRMKGAGVFIRSQTAADVDIPPVQIH